MKVTTSVWSILVSLLAVLGLSGCNKVTELIVTPKESAIPIGMELQLKAEKLFMTGLVLDVTSSDEITWSSSDDSIATVNSGGLVMAGNNTGTVTITASGNFNGVNFEDSASVEVIDAVMSSVEVDPHSATIPVGFKQAFNANALFSNGQSFDVTNSSELTWSSSNKYVTSVSNALGEKGVAKGELTGSSLIIASIAGLTDDAELQITNATAESLEVTPQIQTSPIGLSQAFKALVYLSNDEVIDVTEDPSITWSTSDASIATISNDLSNKGIAKAKNVGVAEIVASGEFNGIALTDSAKLEVTDALVVSLSVKAETDTLPVGLTTQFTALATLSDGQVIDVTTDDAISWSSSNSDRATVSNSRIDKGLVTGVSVGMVSVTAYGEINGRTVVGSAFLNVVDAVAIGLSVTPKPQDSLVTPQIVVGNTLQFKAEAMLSDGSIVDVTNSASLNWSSENTAIASISNGSSDKGAALGVDVGTSLITAEFNSGNVYLTDSSELTVTPLHTLSFDVSTDKYNNSVQGEAIHYIGYVRRVMGQYRTLTGERFLDSSMEMIYVDGVEGKSIEEHTFYFGQVDQQPISGALRYKAIFEWPDDTVTQGILEWQFEERHYKLVETIAVKNLLGEEWDFKITVTNEEAF
ncbi:TPA: Ig-like domain-containing protein [Vibrio campbellii]|uniref:Ig-like domain-containing protein n=1 Tax=Vibrio campbellii TaxID=680 RepID=UPI00390A5869